MKIEDGTGTGYLAGVNLDSQLEVFAIIEPEDKFKNKTGKVWSYTFDVTPAGANDYFFYLENTGTATLALTDIRVSSTVATRLNYKVVSGTPSYISETNITPINRNLGRADIPSATCVYDTDITGLTDEGTFFFEQCKNTDQRYKLSTSSNILISQGKAIAFQRVAATGTITMTVSITIV